MEITFLHLYNRGTEKRDIFLCEPDYFRFLTNLQRNYAKYKVAIHAFSLLPNHYHLLISINSDSNLGKFMQCVATGYTRYFNTKYKRNGVLFQGPYKAKEIEDEPGLIWVNAYVSGNEIVHGSCFTIEEAKWSSANSHIQWIEPLSLEENAISKETISDICCQIREGRKGHKLEIEE